MSFMDEAKDKLSENDEKVDQGIEKAGDAVDERAGGHEQQVDQAQDFLQERTGGGDTVEGGRDGGDGEGRGENR